MVTLELGVLLKSNIQCEIVKCERKNFILLTLLNKAFLNLKTTVLDMSFLTHKGLKDFLYFTLNP